MSVVRPWLACSTMEAMRGRENVMRRGSALLVPRPLANFHRITTSQVCASSRALSAASVDSSSSSSSSLDAATVSPSNSSKESLSLCVSSPVLLLNHMAERYTSFSRILMEFVDNALDDAEVMFDAQDPDGPGYLRPVRIGVAIDKSGSGKVTVSDNCQGMAKETMERVVCRVGESQKRGQAFVNGQFGFGMQAFRAAAESLTVRSRGVAGGPLNEIAVSRGDVDGFRVMEVEEDPNVMTSETGTQVTIAGLDQHWQEALDAETIVTEIEEHFERLLARRNLHVTVSEVEKGGKKSITCQPFLYGVDHEEFKTLKFIKESFVWPAPTDESNTIPPQTFEVRLAVVDTPQEKRRPRFFVNGRRISEIAKTKSFFTVSSARWEVWENPQIIGFIDVSSQEDGALQPVITRDEFKRTRGRRGAFTAIRNMCEEVLRNAVAEIVDRQTDRRVQSLELMLNDCLTSVAREQKRQENRFKQIHLLDDAAPAESDKEEVPTHVPDITAARKSSLDSSSRSGSSQAPKSRKTQVEFNVKLVSKLHPTDEDAAVAPRSELRGSTIIVDIAHKDFKDRMKRSRLGKEQFDDRLIGYLATVVAAHYRSLYYQQMEERPSSTEDLFEAMVDVYVLLEERLRSNLPALLKQLERTTEKDNQEAVSPLLRRRFRGDR